MIHVQDLHKRFGDTTAVAGVSFDVAPGSVLGLLGPNGAGKTTVVRMLATLLQPDGGSATVAGRDVVGEASEVRSLIGLTGQYAAVDEKLTGGENLTMVARLLGYSRRDADRRAAELLERFSLTDAGDRPVSTYSGGMRRRADLAVSLVGRPRVLFLDEPTTGLDPASRLQLWSIIRELVAEGTTVLLTTQYLEEADELADRIIVIDHGSVIAEGTADELKDDTGGRHLSVQLGTIGAVGAARAVLGGVAGVGDVTCDEDTLSLRVSVGRDPALAARSIAALDDAGLELADFRLERPSLDDVFISLTGGNADGADQPARAADVTGAAR
jgi:ABC-2 type transport system ATP-binding protein